jgi:hypothetical protein
MTYRSRTEDKPWQARALAHTREWITGAVLMDPGMGKTKVNLDTAGHAYTEGEIDMVLAVAPNGVHEVWPEEAALHLGVDHVAAAYRSGTVNNPIKDVLRSKGKLKIVSINIESLSHKSGLSMARELMEGRRVLLIVDEAQKIRTPSSARTRNIWKLGEMAVMRRIASGTIIVRGLENLYAPYRFLHWQIINCRTFTEFKSLFCVERGPFHEIVGYRNQDELMARIGQRTFFAYEDEMGLEAPVVSNRYVALSSEQQRLYAELRKTYMAELRSGALVEAPLAITRLQKFQQLIGGHLRLDTGGWEPVPAPRLDDTVDVVGNMPSKTLVWGQWQPDILQLSEKFDKAGISHVTYYGGNTPTQNRENLAKFKSDPSVHAFLATQSSGGAGLTINEAKRTVNFTHTFNTEHAWQARKRNHRLGQDEQIHVVNMVAKGTVDVKLLMSGQKKWDIASLLRNPALMEAWLDGKDD